MASNSCCFANIGPIEKLVTLPDSIHHTWHQNLSTTCTYDETTTTGMLTPKISENQKEKEENHSRHTGSFFYQKPSSWNLNIFGQLSHAVPAFEDQETSRDWRNISWNFLNLLKSVEASWLFRKVSKKWALHTYTMTEFYFLFFTLKHKKLNEESRTALIIIVCTPLPT